MLAHQWQAARMEATVIDPKRPGDWKFMWIDFRLELKGHVESWDMTPAAGLSCSMPPASSSS